MAADGEGEEGDRVEGVEDRLRERLVLRYCILIPRPLPKYPCRAVGSGYRFAFGTGLYHKVFFK